MVEPYNKWWEGKRNFSQCVNWFHCDEFRLVATTFQDIAVEIATTGKEYVMVWAHCLFGLGGAVYQLFMSETRILAVGQCRSIMTLPLFFLMRLVHYEWGASDTLCMAY